MFLFTENQYIEPNVSPEQETVLEGFFKLATTILELGYATLYLFDHNNHLLVPFLEYSRRERSDSQTSTQTKILPSKVISVKSKLPFPVTHAHNTATKTTGGDLNMPIRLNGRLLAVFQASELSENWYHDNYATPLQVLELLVEQLTVNLNITRQLNNILTPALTDPVTRLPNRLFLENFLKADLEHAARHRFEVAMLVLQLQNLVTLCEEYEPGYLIGGLPVQEFIIRRIAQLLQPDLNENDIIVRLDSTSFALVLHHQHEVKSYRTALQLYQLINEDSELSNLKTPLELRFGISSYPYLANDANNLLNQAIMAAQSGRKNEKKGQPPIKIWKASPSAELEKLTAVEDLPTCRAILQGFTYYPIARSVYRRLDPNIIPLQFARQNLCVPLKIQRNSVLTVAMVNPFDHELIAQLAGMTGYHVMPVVSTRHEIENALLYLSRTSVTMLPRRPSYSP